MTKTVLIADDDQLIRDMVTKVLQKNGFVVTTASDGEEAVDTAIAHRFDIIITDIMMPIIEGIEVIAEIIGKWPDTKIIAISSESSAGRTSLLTLAETMGAATTLEKPFSAQQLMDTISALD